MLTGQAKKDYQRNYMRKRRGLTDRSNKEAVGLTIPQEVPLYNPATHRAGDTVRIWKGKRLLTMVIPVLDGDGNPIPD